MLLQYYLYCFSNTQDQEYLNKEFSNILIANLRKIIKYGLAYHLRKCDKFTFTNAVRLIEVCFYV